MYVILSQRIDKDSSYSDEPFKSYHFPARYKNHLKIGDIFIYYQGDRFVREHRYYYGTGKIGNIILDDSDGSYYAELINCKKFKNKIPIYLENGYIEQMDFSSVRKSCNPPWQSYVRPISNQAYDYIISQSGIVADNSSADKHLDSCDFSVNQNNGPEDYAKTNDSASIEYLKDELKAQIKNFYVYKQNDAILEVKQIVNQIAGKLYPNIDAYFQENYVPDRNRHVISLLDYCISMQMSFSYKPVLIKAVLFYADEKGKVKLSNIVAYFREFYERRRNAGLPIEKANSIFAKGGYTDKEAELNILVNPFKCFEDMQMLRYTKTLGVIQVDEVVWKSISNDEKGDIEKACDEKLERYFDRLKG